MQKVVHLKNGYKNLINKVGNESAEMSLAMEIVRALETVGGGNNGKTRADWIQ